VAVEVKLPRLGQGMESGTIVRWLKTEGDMVAKGDPLYELDTDKVTQEVESEADGTLLKIVIAEGEVDVGTLVGVLGGADEDVSELVSAAPGGDGDRATTSPEAELSTSAPIRERPGERPNGDEQRLAAVATVAPDAGVAPSSPPAPQPVQPASAERVKASPLARRIARERSVDLTAIAGTGPDGRIVAEDVEKATAAAPVAAPPFVAQAEIEVVPLTSIRRTIARRLTEAWQAPVFQLVVTADASGLTNTREQLVELVREGEVKPTVNDVLTRLVAAALVRHRAVNAQFLGDEVHRYPSANIGIAVATPNGLIVPVVRAADRKSVQEIASVRADLVGRAREGRLQLVDLEDGTFTISNLGMYGIDEFTAVLNPPQVAILAVGSIERRVLAVGDRVELAPTLTMTLTCDHRAIDGSEGAEFLATLKAFVENPALAL
jgi:pyruvate dehydrogenase E2 component (dihydrolipoamide acetyltransferase)